MGTPLMGASIAGGVGRRAAVHRARSTKRGIALYTVTVDVNRVYDSKAGRYAEDNRAESNCTH